MAVVLLSKGIRKKLKDFQSEVLAAMILGNFLLALTDIFSAWLPGMNVPGCKVSADDCKGYFLELKYSDRISFLLLLCLSGGKMETDCFLEESTVVFAGDRHDCHNDRPGVFRCGFCSR